jgi:hypothetical protein
MENEPGQGGLFTIEGPDEDRDQSQAKNKLMGIGTVERAYQLARDSNSLDELR